MIDNKMAENVAVQVFSGWSDSAADSEFWLAEGPSADGWQRTAEWRHVDVHGAWRDWSEGKGIVVGVDGHASEQTRLHAHDLQGISCLGIMNYGIQDMLSTELILHRTKHLAFINGNCFHVVNC